MWFNPWLSHFHYFSNYLTQHVALIDVDVQLRPALQLACCVPLASISLTGPRAVASSVHRAECSMELDLLLASIAFLVSLPVQEVSPLMLIPP